MIDVGVSHRVKASKSYHLRLCFWLQSLQHKCFPKKKGLLGFVVGGGRVTGGGPFPSNEQKRNEK